MFENVNLLETCSLCIHDNNIKCCRHRELLTCLYVNQLQELYPNLWVALHIALTLLVSSRLCLAKFFKTQKQTNKKTCESSSMGQKHLRGLNVTSINSELAQKLSYDDPVNDFAAKKCRRVSV